MGDVKHVGLDDEPTATLYAPFYQIPEYGVSFLTNNMSLVIRTGHEGRGRRLDPLSLATAARREIQAVDKDVPASSVRSMEQFLGASVAPRRFSLLLLWVFAGAALLLAATGTYAVISYSVARRTPGAQQGDVLRLVLGQGLKVVLIGVAIGLAAAFALTRLIASLLFGVSAADPWTFAVMALLLTAAGVLATYIPARRGARTDPLLALRCE